MNKMNRSICFLAISIAMASVGINAAITDPLEKDFANPPDAARPHIYWYWINGNISREGITADLEAMAKVGIGGAGIFNIGGHAPAGPVKVLSPQWHDLMKHAISEAKRLGIEINLNNSMTGWSSSGGPWITPELAMKRVTWSEVIVEGHEAGEAITLPQPPSNLGYYRDISVLAFPTPPAERDQEQCELTSNILQFDRTLVDNYSDLPLNINWDMDSAPGAADVRLNTSRDETPFIQWSHSSPVRIRSMQVVFSEGSRLSGVIKASDDGVSWRHVQTFAGRRPSTVSCVFKTDPATFWRIEFDPNPGIVLTGVRLWQGYRIADYTAKAMFDFFGLDRPPFTDADLSHTDPLPECVIPHEAIVNLTKKMTAGGRLNWKVPPGQWTILRFGYVPTGSQSGPGFTGITAYECDKFDTAALDVHFANSLQPWFDDPELNEAIRYVHIDSYERGAQNWTAAMPKEFVKHKQYDMDKWLPVLTGRVVENVRASERFLWDFRNVTCSLMHENYFGHMRRLCEKAGKQFTCEAYHQNQFNNVTAGGHAHIPMTETWMRESIPGPYYMKLGASPAHVYGRKIVAAEAFTAPGWNGGNWNTDFFDMKELGDAMFCGGVNLLMYHVYVHQPWLDHAPGITLAVWGTHFERTNTWWEKMSGFNLYTSRCQFMLQRGLFVGDVLYSCGENNPNQNVRPAGALAVPQGYDYDVCDPKVIYERIRVLDNKLVLPDGMTYSLLVLPDDPSMTLKMLRRVDRLAAAGAVIVGRTKPIFSPSLADMPSEMKEFEKLTHKLWDGKRIISDKTVAEVLKTIASPDFETRNATDFVRYIHRSDKGNNIYFLANSGDAAQEFDAVFRTKTEMPPLLMDPVTGEIRALPQYMTENDRTIIQLKMEPKQSFFIIFGEHNLKPTDKKNFPETKLLKKISGPWTVGFDPKLGGPEKPAIFPELSDWTTHTNAGIKYYSGTAVYRKKFDCRSRLPESTAYLSLGDVNNVAMVMLNGQSLGIIWCAPWQVAIPTGLLKNKNNELVIEVVNLWPNRMIGDEQFPDDSQFYHSAEWDPFTRTKTMSLKAFPDWLENETKRPSGRYSFATIKLWDKDSPLLPSGLLGPVTLSIRE